MQIIVNQHIKNNVIQDQWVHVIRSNHAHRHYSNLTESSLKRIARNALNAKSNIYDGEEGQGYILQTRYEI